MYTLNTKEALPLCRILFIKKDETFVWPGKTQRRCAPPSAEWLIAHASPESPIAVWSASVFWLCRGNAAANMMGHCRRCHPDTDTDCRLLLLSLGRIKDSKVAVFVSVQKHRILGSYVCGLVWCRQFFGWLLAFWPALYCARTIVFVYIVYNIQRLCSQKGYSNMLCERVVVVWLLSLRAGSTEPKRCHARNGFLCLTSSSFDVYSFVYVLQGSCARKGPQI